MTELDVLTREEVEQRLAMVRNVDSVYYGTNLTLNREREALQTALAAMDERDALAAEGRLLAKWIADPPRNTSETANWNYPTIAAEVERVRRLEAAVKERNALAARAEMMREIIEECIWSLKWPSMEYLQDRLAEAMTIGGDRDNEEDR